jgi:hypothetical protein
MRSPRGSFLLTRGPPQVHLQIHGTKGSTTKMELPGRTKRPNRPAFERKQVCRGAWPRVTVDRF